MTAFLVAIIVIGVILGLAYLFWVQFNNEDD